MKTSFHSFFPVLFFMTATVFGQAEWVPFTGKIPANAVVGGMENGKPIYVDRVPYKGGVHPGKVFDFESHGFFCAIGWNTKVRLHGDGFEVLTAPANSVESAGEMKTDLSGC
jgi:hypothetical protein